MTSKALHHHRPLLVTEVNHVAINVSDLEASSAFYHTVLGFSTRRSAQFRNVLRNGSIELHLFQAPVSIGSHRPRNWRQLGVQHLALSISDEELDRAVEMLAVKGSGVDGPIQDEMGKALYTHDPDGNVIELRVGT